MQAIQQARGAASDGLTRRTEGSVHEGWRECVWFRDLNLKHQTIGNFVRSIFNARFFWVEFFTTEKGGHGVGVEGGEWGTEEGFRAEAQGRGGEAERGLTRRRGDTKVKEKGEPEGGERR